MRWLVVSTASVAVRTASVASPSLVGALAPDVSSSSVIWGLRSYCQNQSGGSGLVPRPEHCFRSRNELRTRRIEIGLVRVRLCRSSVREPPPSARKRPTRGLLSPRWRRPLIVYRVGSGG